MPLNTSRMPLAVLCPASNQTAFSAFPIWDDVGHSTVESGAALLMWFRADFPHGTSAQQELGPESPESVLAPGEKWRIICEVRPRFVYVETTASLSGT